LLDGSGRGFAGVSSQGPKGELKEGPLGRGVAGCRCIGGSHRRGGGRTKMMSDFKGVPGEGGKDGLQETPWNQIRAGSGHAITSCKRVYGKYPPRSGGWKGKVVELTILVKGIAGGLGNNRVVGKKN